MTPTSGSAHDTERKDREPEPPVERFRRITAMFDFEDILGCATAAAHFENDR